MNDGIGTIQDIAERGFDGINACSEHSINVIWKDVAEVYGAWSDGYDEGEESTLSFCRLKDGRFVVVEEWSDYTGHGCQCSGTARFADSYEALVNGHLTAEERDRLGIADMEFEL